VSRSEGVQATGSVNARRVAVRSIAWLDGLCDRTLAKLDVHAIIVGLFEVSRSIFRGEDLN
jgi:hypothetical protein